MSLISSPLCYFYELSLWPSKLLGIDFCHLIFLYVFSYPTLPFQSVFLCLCSSKYEVHEILSFPSADPRSDPHRKICVWRCSGNECWPDDSTARKGLKRPVLPRFLHRIRFVISRSCVRVTLPAPSKNRTGKPFESFLCGFSFLSQMRICK